VSNPKIEAGAEHIEDALARTLAEALGCDQDDVDIRVQAPGLAEHRGRWHVALSFEDAAGPGHPGAHGDEVAAGADAEVVAAGETEAVRDADGRDADAVPERASVGTTGGELEVDTTSVVDAPDEDGGEPAEDHGVPAEHDRDEDVEDADGAERFADAGGDTLETEAEAAADFVEGLLDALDLPGDLRITYADDHAEVEVVDVGSGALIGRRGQTLEAIQELLRCSLQREFQRRARVKIDVEGYRSRRLEKLLEKADEAIDAVLDSGEPERLEPMDVFERKAVHHRVAKVDGLISRSQGREPARRIVIERG
jgi:spoIIIJ-associated protein